MKLIVFFALAIVALSRAAIAGTVPPSGQLGSLDAWVGRWTFSGQIYATPYSQAHVDTGVTDCSLAANKGYLICDYFSDNPAHDDLSVVTYDTSAKGYNLVLVHRDRSSSSEKLVQHGNTWISSRSVVDNGKTLTFKTTFVFLTPEKQTTKVQISPDIGRTWYTMIQVTALRVAR